MNLGIRIGIMVTAGFGLWGAGYLSLEHWQGKSSCPMLGSLAICYIVLTGYGLMVISMAIKTLIIRTVFLIGWIPVAVIALIGVVGEVSGVYHCPHAVNGWPKCYLSAMLVCVIGLLFWLLCRGQKAIANGR